MMGGAKAHYDGIRAFSETDFTEDLKVIDVPTLVMHGDDDQILPEGLRNLATWHVHDARRRGQRRPVRLHQGLTMKELRERQRELSARSQRPFCPQPLTGETP